MNALPSVAATAPTNSQAAPPTSGAPLAQASGPASSTFADALQDAGAKPARKSASAKADVSDDGARLPGTGKSTPLPVPPAATVLPPDAAVPMSANLAGGEAFAGAAARGGEAPTAVSESPGVTPASPSAAAIDAGDGLPVGVSGSTFGLLAAGLSGPASGDVAAAANDAAVNDAADRSVSGAAIEASAAHGAAATTGESRIGSRNVLRATFSQGFLPASTKVGASGDSEAADDAANGPNAASPLGMVPAVSATGTAGAAGSSAAEGALEFAAASAGSAAAAGNATPSQPTDAAVAAETTGVAGGLAPLPGSVAGIGGAASITSLSSALTAARAAVGAVNADDSSTPGAVGNEYRHTRGDADAPSLDGGSVDAAAGLSQSNSVDTGAAPTFRVSASVTGSDFSQELADRVSFMASNDLNGAKLQVTPAQLGPIELRISVTGDHAQVWMSTHSAVTRDALESSAPKLREMLGAQGFGQVSVDISQRSFQDRSAYAQPYESPVSEGSAAGASALPVAGRPRVSAGTLDAYA